MKQLNIHILAEWEHQYAHKVRVGMIDNELKEKKRFMNFFWQT